MKIGSRDLGEKIFLVAEIGNNHEGRFDVACELVRRAAETGVDAVKFQTFCTRMLQSATDEARFRRLSSFELSPEQFRELAALARSHGLGFWSTPLDLESARMLEPLVDAFKIASGDNDFFPLIAQVAKTGKPVIVSSGMTDLAHLRRVVTFAREHRVRDLAVLHCVTSYPAPPEQIHLAAIPLLSRELDCTIGYSDHTIGIEAALAAAALGARIVEKHFTLDKHFSEFRDHQLSADPDEMKRIVEGVRRVELLVGRAEKAVQPCEEPFLVAARRATVAGRDLPAGHRLAAADLAWIRPAVGLPPGSEGQLVGRTLKRALRFGEPIRLSDVE